MEAEDEVYFIKGGKRYRFFSERTRDSWGLKRVYGSEASLSRFPKAKTVMGFRDGTLIMDFADNTLYLISNSKRRKITNPDWLDYLSLEVTDAILASEREVYIHAEGEDLS